MTKPQLASLGDVWAVEPCALENYAALLRGLDADALRTQVRTKEREHEDALSFITSRQMDQLPGSMMTGVYNGVAVIPVNGMIRPRASYNFYSLFSTNLVSLTHDFELAMQSSAVESILFNVDSPGGLVSGVQEFCEKIYEARGTKPIKAYVPDLIASAAYWIGCATDEIVIAKTAEAGSIGTLVSFFDWSEYDKKLGIEQITIVNDESPRKGTDPASEEGQAQIRARLNELADTFISTVARNRGVDRETVVSDFGQGDLIVGEGAVAVGLVDRLGSFDAVLSELSNETQPLGGIGMSDKTKSPTASEQPITAELIASDYPEIASHFRSEGQAAGAKAERDRIQAIEQKFPEASVQKIVHAHKFDPEMTVEQISLKIYEAMQSGDIDQMAALEADAPDPLDADASSQDKEDQAREAEMKSAREAAEAVNQERN